MCVPQNTSLPWITTLISQLSSDKLVTLSLSIYADNMLDLLALDSECGVRESLPAHFDELQALDWSALDATFKSERLRSFETLTLLGQGTPDSLREWLQLSFPDLSLMLEFVEERV